MKTKESWEIDFEEFVKTNYQGCDLGEDKSLMKDIWQAAYDKYNKKAEPKSKRWMDYEEAN